ncbi:hypothetical protein WKI68_39665 [Streptomyces sp. MS1.HAVA.3]|uniref:Uncharacterized protein n=1 Tax=Streptomyces caledonius TaxID=3134107 RepID=A0ABU8UCQ9_9ACTN
MARRRKAASRLVSAGLVAGAMATALSVPYAHADGGDGGVEVLCSVAELASAMRAANASAGADTIRLAPKCTYRLTEPDSGNPANGLPEITSEITIEGGRGTTIVRAATAPRFRVLAVTATGALTLNRTTVSGGDATDCPAFGSGVCGGGIAAIGALNLNHSTVKDNTARSDFFAEGGGVHAGGPTAVNHSVLSNNTVVYDGTEPSSAIGGGLLTFGPLSMKKSRLSRNSVSVAPGRTASRSARGSSPSLARRSRRASSATTARPPGRRCPGRARRGSGRAGERDGDRVHDSGNVSSAPDGTAAGGGVAANFPLVMRDVTITDNTAAAPRGIATAGGLQVGPSGDVEISRSIVRGDRAVAEGGTAQGGGIASASGGALRAVDVRITRNVATAEGGTAQGGGLFNAVGTSTLTGGSVTRNRADDDGGGSSNCRGQCRWTTRRSTATGRTTADRWGRFRAAPAERRGGDLATKSSDADGPPAGRPRRRGARRGQQPPSRKHRRGQRAHRRGSDRA